jgi:hypothetical protein
LQQEAEQAGEDTENYSVYNHHKLLVDVFVLPATWCRGLYRQALKSLKGRPCEFGLNKHRIREAIAPAPHRENSQQKRSSGHWANRRRSSNYYCASELVETSSPAIGTQDQDIQLFAANSRGLNSVKSRHISCYAFHLPAKGAEGKCTPYYQVNPAAVLLDTDGDVALQQMLFVMKPVAVSKGNG